MSSSKGIFDNVLRYMAITFTVMSRRNSGSPIMLFIYSEPQIPPSTTSSLHIAFYNPTANANPAATITPHAPILVSVAPPVCTVREYVAVGGFETVRLLLAEDTTCAIAVGVTHTVVYAVSGGGQSVDDCTFTGGGINDDDEATDEEDKPHTGFTRAPLEVALKYVQTEAMRS